MLTKDLLRYRIDDGEIRPGLIDLGSPRYRQTARDLIKLFQASLGQTLGQIEDAVDNYAASRTDHRILRGLAKVLMSFAEFEQPSMRAAAIREAVFERAGKAWPILHSTSSKWQTSRQRLLAEAAQELDLSPEGIEQQLYGDLPRRRRLVKFVGLSGPQNAEARPSECGSPTVRRACSRAPGLGLQAPGSELKRASDRAEASVLKKPSTRPPESGRPMRKPDREGGRVWHPAEPEALLVRYNMELARGLLYWAEGLTVDVEDSYQDVFRYLKLSRLMHTILRLERGYRIEVDGPSSLLRKTTRYGIRMAKFLPALALCRKWRMEAAILLNGERLRYQLDNQSGLVSHFGRFPPFDSRVEQDFAADFERALETNSHKWQLCRADAVVELERNEVLIPDFTLRHDSGKDVHLEIMGFWTPEYLLKKVQKIRAARLDNLLLAVSNRLALDESITEQFPTLWFAKKLSVRHVMDRAAAMIGLR